MRLAALISGGKDSLYAAYLAKKAGNDIAYVVSLLSGNPDSYMWHVPNAHLGKVQAELMGVPAVQKATKGEKEKELEDLKSALLGIRGEIDGIVTGAIASEYQKSRIERIAKELGVASIAPLWHREPAELLNGMLKDGFEVMITAVAAAGLDERWLGRKLDESAIDELLELNKKYGISIVGEGGEFETFVLGCPLFAKRIKVVDAVKNWDEKTRSGTLEIKRVEVVEK